MTPEQLDSIRTMLAFIRALSNKQWDDANSMLEVMMETRASSIRAISMMATLIVDEMPITEAWIDARLATLARLEAEGL